MTRVRRRQVHESGHERLATSMLVDFKVRAPPRCLRCGRAGGGSLHAPQKQKRKSLGFSWPLHAGEVLDRQPATGRWVALQCGHWAAVLKAAAGFRNASSPQPPARQPQPPARQPRTTGTVSGIVDEPSENNTIYLCCVCTMCGLVARSSQTRRFINAPVLLSMFCLSVGGPLGTTDFLNFYKRAVI